MLPIKLPVIKTTQFLVREPKTAVIRHLRVPRDLS